MTTRGQRLGAALSIAAVLVLSLVQFAHTERGPFDKDGCPACQVQHASLGVLQAPPLIVTLCVLIGTLDPESQSRPASFSSSGLASRAPPSV